MEGLWRLGGVNVLKGQVRAEGMEQSHMAAENIGEQRRMLRMKFYVTHTSLMTRSPAISDLFLASFWKGACACLALMQALQVFDGIDA